MSHVNTEARAPAEGALLMKDSNTSVQAGLIRAQNVSQSGRKDTDLALHEKMIQLWDQLGSIICNNK